MNQASSIKHGQNGIEQMHRNDEQAMKNNDKW